MKWLKCISVLILVSFTACKSPQLSQVEATYLEVNAHSGIDSNLYYFLQSYKSELDTQMNQIISSTPEDLTRAQPSSNLGNMMTDIIYDYYLEQNQAVDFVVLNFGGIRVPSIAKGNLSIRDAYQLMPFDNEIVQMKISGHKVLQFVEHIIQLGGWPVSNMDIVIDSNKNIQQIVIQNKLLQLDQEYTVATNDYIANGGDKCDFLIEEKKIPSGKLLRDAIIESWSKQKQGIQVDNTKRIRYE